MRTKNLYPDNIFGGVNHPAKGARYHRQHALGIHHFSFHHPNPVAAGEPILSWAATSGDRYFETVTAQYTLDDWKTSALLSFQKAGLQWDTVAWTWQTHWQASFPALQTGQVLRYRLFGTLPNGKKVFADNQSTSPKNATEYAIYADPNPGPPNWSENARVYQIFVDRFNRGNHQPWLQTKDLHQPFGGTLQGIIEKMDMIQALGFNTLWLTPIFKTPSHHGYDCTDYLEIEPRFGSKEDLRQLIDLAHARQMRVILDFVANHVSDQHPMFKKALASPLAAERDWFCWTRWPKYQTFGKVKSMPKLQLSFGSPARQHLLEAAQYWLQFGVDGYRLDHANGPDRAFWVDFRRACKAINPDVWLFAEVVLPPDAQASYLGSFDGTLDFMTCQALRECFARHSYKIEQLANYLETYPKQFPDGFSRPAFVDNHDMNRFLFTAQGNVMALHAALTLLYLMPGQSIIYAGTEIGISQPKSIHDKGSRGFDESRLPMDWTKTDTESSQVLKELNHFREGHSWLSAANWKALHIDTQKQTAIFEVCGSDQSLTVSVCLAQGAEKVSILRDSSSCAHRG